MSHSKVTLPLGVDRVRVDGPDRFDFLWAPTPPHFVKAEPGVPQSGVCGFPTQLFPGERTSRLAYKNPDHLTINF